jgi:hypothetical protein
MAYITEITGHTYRQRRDRRRQAARNINEADATRSYEPQSHMGKGYTASPKDVERRKDQEQSPSGVCM